MIKVIVLQAELSTYIEHRHYNNGQRIMDTTRLHRHLQYIRQYTAYFKGTQSAPQIRKKS